MAIEKQEILSILLEHLDIDLNVISDLVHARFYYEILASFIA